MPRGTTANIRRSRAPFEAAAGGTQASVRSFVTYGGTATDTSSIVPMPTVANGASADWQIGDAVYIGYELTATTGTVTLPSGWTDMFTPFRSSGTTNSLHGVMRRVMQSGDSNTLTVSHSSGRFAAVSVAVKDEDQATPEDVASTTDDNSASPEAYPNVRAPSIDPTAANTLLLTFHACRNGTNGATTTFTPPSGMTECGDATSNVAAVSNAAVEAAYLQLSSGDATGTKIATASSSSGTTINQMGSAIAVRSAAAGELQTVSATGITSAEASGATQVQLNLAPIAVPTGELVGASAVTTSYQITAAAISSAETAGSAQVAQQLAAVGVRSGEAVGISTTTQIISPTGIGSAEAAGAITTTATASIAPAGISSVETSGAAFVGQALAPSAIQTAERTGTAAVTPGVATVSPAGIPTAEEVGNAVTAVAPTQTISPVGIPSGQQFDGDAEDDIFGDNFGFVVTLFVTPAPIASAEKFGSSTITSILSIIATGIPSAEATGNIVATPGTATIAPSGISTAEAVGNAFTAVAQPQTISPASIPSEQRLGAASIAQALSAASISTAERFGNALTSPGPVTVTAVSVASGQEFGLTTVGLTLSPKGVAPAERFGATAIGQAIAPSGIFSAEILGHTLVVPATVIILAHSVSSIELLGIVVVELLVEGEAVFVLAVYPGYKFTGVYVQSFISAVPEHEYIAWAGVLVP